MLGRRGRREEEKRYETRGGDILSNHNQLVKLKTRK